jgi:hypothetical protein
MTCLHRWCLRFSHLIRSSRVRYHTVTLAPENVARRPGHSGGLAKTTAGIHDAHLDDAEGATGVVLVGLVGESPDVDAARADDERADSRRARRTIADRVGPCDPQPYRN